MNESTIAATASSASSSSFPPGTTARTASSISTDERALGVWKAAARAEAEPPGPSKASDPSVSRVARFSRGARCSAASAASAASRAAARSRMDACEVFPIASSARTLTSGTASKGVSGSRIRFPPFGSTSAAWISRSSCLVIASDTRSARPCHLMPICPNDGVASMSSVGSPTNPNQSLSPGGGGIHTRVVPASRLILTVMEMGTPAIFRATAPMSLDAFFFAKLRSRRIRSSADDGAALSTALSTAISTPASRSESRSRSSAPPRSSAAIISAYTERSRCVVRVISATPAKSTSSSAAAHAPRPAREPPSQGAADVPGFAAGGRRAARTCGVDFPRCTFETEIGPTKRGRSGIPEHKPASCSVTSAIFSGDRCMSKKMRDASALMAAPAAPPEVHPASAAPAASAADRTLASRAKTLNASTSRVSERARLVAASAAAPACASAPGAAPARLLCSATVHASFAASLSA